MALNQTMELSRSLSPPELAWSAIYFFLLEKGYRLRARYHPDWTPPRSRRIGIPVRLRQQRLDEEHENLLPILASGQALDAIRISNGKSVWLKYMATSSVELSILRRTSAEDCRDDPRNHCVPLLDVFDVPKAKGAHSIAVMPMLRACFDPPMRMFVEALAFIDQMLEGLAFLHKMKISHGDIKPNNILMHADAMYPDGFNPLTLGRDNSPLKIQDTNPSASRVDVPVTYTYIDFGFGNSFESDEETHLVRWTGGTFIMPEVYEIPGDRKSAKTRLYDPFKADIWLLGQIFSLYFRRPWVKDFPKISPLLDAMSEADPLLRPSAAECLSIHREHVLGLSTELCFRLPSLPLVSYGKPLWKRWRAEIREEKEYRERLARFLQLCGGSPRLLKHMQNCEAE